MTLEPVDEPLVDILRSLPDERAVELQRSLIDIDHAVRRYHRRRAGLEPFPDIVSLLPPSLPEDVREACRRAIAAEHDEKRAA